MSGDRFEDSVIQTFARGATVGLNFALSEDGTMPTRNRSVRREKDLKIKRDIRDRWPRKN
jgi:hypothetical protein